MRHAALIGAEELLAGTRFAGEDLLVDQALGIPLAHILDRILEALLGEGVHHLAIAFEEVHRGIGARRARTPQQHQAIDLVGAGIEPGDLVLLAVAVGIAIAESLEHGVELVDVLRGLQAELVEPVLAHPPAARHGAIRHVGEEVDVAVGRGDRLGDLRVFLQEGLEVGCVLVDQLVQRLQRTFHAAADELVLQAIAADDVGQLAGGHKQVVLLAAVGRHLARGIDQLDVGEAGQLLGHRPVFVPHVLVAEVHVDAEIQGLGRNRLDSLCLGGGRRYEQADGSSDGGDADLVH